MSYCRWSSDNWQSDIYAYESVDGYFAIHVAGQKRVGDIPELPNILTVSAEEFIEAYTRQDEALERAQLVPIGLPYDGQTFKELTIEAAIARMKFLQQEGYHVPDWAIVTLVEEEANEQAN